MPAFHSCPRKPAHALAHRRVRWSSHVMLAHFQNFLGLANWLNWSYVPSCVLTTVGNWQCWSKEMRLIHDFKIPHHFPLVTLGNLCSKFNLNKFLISESTGFLFHHSLHSPVSLTVSQVGTSYRPFHSEKSGTSHTVAANVNWCNHYWKQYLWSYKN